jgi:transposase-like protein
MRRKPRNHSTNFEGHVALEAVKGDNTLAELAEKHDIHPHQITERKK